MQVALVTVIGMDARMVNFYALVGYSFKVGNSEITITNTYEMLGETASVTIDKMVQFALKVGVPFKVGEHTVIVDNIIQNFNEQVPVPQPPVDEPALVDEPASAAYQPLVEPASAAYQLHVDEPASAASQLHVDEPASVASQHLVEHTSAWKHVNGLFPTEMPEPKSLKKSSPAAAGFNLESAKIGKKPKHFSPEQWKKHILIRLMEDKADSLNKLFFGTHKSGPFTLDIVEKFYNLNNELSTHFKTADFDFTPESSSIDDAIRHFSERSENYIQNEGLLFAIFWEYSWKTFAILCARLIDRPDPSFASDIVSEKARSQGLILVNPHSSVPGHPRFSLVHETDISKIPLHHGDKVLMEMAMYMVVLAQRRDIPNQLILTAKTYSKTLGQKVSFKTFLEMVQENFLMNNQNPALSLSIVDQTITLIRKDKIPKFEKLVDEAFGTQITFHRHTKRTSRNPNPFCILPQNVNSLVVRSLIFYLAKDGIFVNFDAKPVWCLKRIGF